MDQIIESDWDLNPKPATHTSTVSTVLIHLDRLMLNVWQKRSMWQRNQTIFQFANFLGPSKSISKRNIIGLLWLLCQQKQTTMTNRGSASLKCWAMIGHWCKKFAFKINYVTKLQQETMTTRKQSQSPESQ